jgi:hypothetical protein
MRAPIRFRNSLAFPGGVRPGIDWTHPALIAVPASQLTTLQSWIPSGKALINLTNGAKTGAVGTVNAANTVIGPTTVYPLASNNYSTYTPPGAGVVWTTGTFGSIFILTAASTQVFLCRTLNGSASYVQMILTMQPGFSVAGIQQTFTNIPALSLNVPYFYGFSLRNGRQYAVVVDLSTGKTWVDTKTIGIVNETSGQFLFGALMAGNIAAQMCVSGSIGLPGLLAWAERPWDFWYPPTLGDMILSSGKAFPPPPITATVAVTETPDTVYVNATGGPNPATIAVTETPDVVSVNVSNASIVTTTVSVTETPDSIRASVSITGQVAPQFGATGHRRVSLRSPFAYPGASAIAAVDRRHPVYTTGLRHSCVALGNGAMVNLLTGKVLGVGNPGSGPGPIISVMTPFGPAVNTARQWAALQVPAVIPKEQFANFTGAAIVYVDSISTNNQHLTGTSSTNISQDTTTWLLGSGAGFNFSNRGVNFITNGTFPAVAGHTYFFAASAIANGTGSRRHAVCVDLTTGKTTSISQAGGINTVTADVNYVVGSTFDYNPPHVGGQMIAAMMANAYTSLNDLLAWAERPWDFWYPPEVERALLKSLTVVSSSFNAVDFRGNLQVTPTLAATLEGGSAYGKGFYSRGLYSRTSTWDFVGNIPASVIIRGDFDIIGQDYFTAPLTPSIVLGATTLDVAPLTLVGNISPNIVLGADLQQVLELVGNLNVTVALDSDFGGDTSLAGNIYVSVSMQDSEIISGPYWDPVDPCPPVDWKEAELCNG